MLEYEFEWVCGCLGTSFAVDFLPVNMRSALKLLRDFDWGSKGFPSFLFFEDNNFSLAYLLEDDDNPFPILQVMLKNFLENFFYDVNLSTTKLIRNVKLLPSTSSLF